MISPGQEPKPDSFNSPEAMLDHLFGHGASWSDAECEIFLGRLVERFPADRVIAVLRQRMADLAGARGDAILRLVEAYPVPELLDALARALRDGPELAPERAWEALALLEGAGRLEREPALAELWDELNDLIQGEDPVLELIAQIEDDPEGPWLAYEGLAAIEPELRAQIIAGLEGIELGPRGVAFLKLVADDEPGPAREAARDVLKSLRLDADASATREPDARRETAEGAGAGPSKGGVPTRFGVSERAPGTPGRLAPRIERSLVTAVDGEGLGTIILSARSPQGLATAVFVCDLERGIRAVYGDLTEDGASAEIAFDDLAARLGRESLEGAHELAIGLLSGCLTLTTPGQPEFLADWLRLTTAGDLTPRPFPASFPGWDPASLSFAEMPRRAEAVLDACPDWIDSSPLTYEMAREIQLRDGVSQPDPRRDVGAYRYLFEHGLKQRLERYRRMLLWMAWFWRSSGDEEMGRSALALACQLSDAQHVVPGHPFTVELTTRSLAAAQARMAT